MAIVSTRKRDDKYKHLSKIYQSNKIAKSNKTNKNINIKDIVEPTIYKVTPKEFAINFAVLFGIVLLGSLGYIVSKVVV